MPKERRDRRSSSFDQSRTSPYPCNSKNGDKTKTSLLSVGNEKEWEEARCPVCMEQPHNAVLLLCSSREKGCRPYMCDTSCRHSNCLDKFRKSPAAQYSSDITEEVPVITAAHHNGIQSAGFPERHQTKLVCPLCRGQINGWVVIEPARHLMNSKTRSCSSETCDFIGNYSELRKHARCEHPHVRPTEVDLARQLDWTFSEEHRVLDDLFSALQSESRDEFSENSLIPTPGWTWVDENVSLEDMGQELNEDHNQHSDFNLDMRITFMNVFFEPHLPSSIGDQ